MTKVEEIKRTQFALERVKLEKTGHGVEVCYTLENVIGQEHYYDRQRIVSQKIPHPDLINKLNSLKRIMTLTSGRCIELNTMEEEKSKYRVTGISVSGDESKGVIIMGTYECQNSTKIAVLTPRIKLDDEVFEIEAELKKAVEDLTEEAYQYVYHNKQAQLSMDFAG